MSFTAEQRAAVADRGRSSLLAAGAGSGKTAVMVERFCEAVCHDGVPVGGILALTFTEKAAGELRERIRRRFAELGEDEHARAVDGAWVGTIHGFCARVLRTQALAAGLDPRFTVLDEGAARRLAAEAFERALDAWTAGHGTPALDLAAAYAYDLETMITGAHAELRSRGHTHPRLAVPRAAPPPSPAALLDAASAAAAALQAAPGNGARVTAALQALEAAERLLSSGAGSPGRERPAPGPPSGEPRATPVPPGGEPRATPVPPAGEPRLTPVPPAGEPERPSVPLPGDLDVARLPTGGKALEDPACDAYREAWAELRAACADHHARPALLLLDGLLQTFGGEYAAAKDGRAGVDFEDLELRVRDLLAADPALRERWAARFALIMVDEFQDTNHLQLDILEALERDNLFAVGDESQSIYGFRHADVEIFRARRATLDAAGVRGLTINFRSRPEILDVVNGAFAPVLGSGFTPLKAGRAGGELRLFEPGPQEEPHVEMLVCDTGGWEEVEPSLGLGTLAQQAWRRAEARAVAHRLRVELDGGRRARDLVVLVRATTSLRLYEQALEEQGLPTYVVGGRGYWSQEQVRDGIAYLSVLANPLDETSLYATLASPFCGVGADALVLLAAARRHDGSGAWAALQRPPERWPEAPDPADAARLRAFAAFAAGERGRAERLPVEVLLERAIAGTGYDLAILARAGGDRRLANIRKLMRLAREYERAEGRDLRGFLAYAASQDLAEAREGEAALESEALDAVRLMTIHRAKGLEFPVVCVADLGRPGQSGRPRLLLGRDGTAGLKLVTTAGGDPVPALGYDAIAAARAAQEAAEERRLLYVAATRAEERLILSGGTDLTRWPDARPGGPPLDWLAPALLGDAEAVLDGMAAAAEEGAASPTGGHDDDKAVVSDGGREGVKATVVSDGGREEATTAARREPPSATVACGDGRVLVRLVTPATLPAAALAPAPRTRAPAPGTVLPAEPRVVPAGGRPQPAQRRLSYSALQDYGRCGYRFYLERVLRLPRVPAPPPAAPEDEAAEAGIDPRVRGTLVHQLLERLDFARPVAPDAEEVLAAGAAVGLALSAEEVGDIAGLVGAFAASPLCARLAAARHVRREAAFAFALEADGGGPLLSGFVDALAREPDGSVLVVDYKSDRLGDDEPAALADRDYGTQRQVYALAALRDGAPAVEVAHCFLERPAAPAVARYTHADAPALAAALLDLAGGVLAERWPVTPRPHRELCGDCPGRRALCSWPESVTLRPSEDARAGDGSPTPYLDSAGTLAGSGGPS